MDAWDRNGWMDGPMAGQSNGHGWMGGWAEQ